MQTGIVTSREELLARFIGVDSITFTCPCEIELQRMSRDKRGKEALIEEQRGEEKLTMERRRRENIEFSLELSNNYLRKREESVGRGGKMIKMGRGIEGNKKGRSVIAGGKWLADKNGSQIVQKPFDSSKFRNHSSRSHPLTGCKLIARGVRSSDVPSSISLWRALYWSRVTQRFYEPSFPYLLFSV